MKKKFAKSAAACGLCLTLLVGGTLASAAFGGPTGWQNGQTDRQSGPTTQQNGPMAPGQQGGMPGGMQQGSNVQYAESPTAVAEGTTSNSAMSLTANESNATTVTMSADNSAVKIDKAGTYVITGICPDGNITVKKGTTGVVLILKDLDLTSTTGATLSVNKGAEAKIVISGSVKLTDAEDPDDENSTDADVADAFDGAAIKVKAGASACITGSGTLTVNGNAKNGIKVSGDETDGYGSLIFDGASITINAANDGINAAYDLAILSGSLTVNAGDDGIHADRILTVGSATASPTVTIGKSYEGIEATVVNLAGGTISVTSSDDGINAANSDDLFKSELDYSINVTGGSVTVNAGFDGLDSNGNINLISGSATIQSANRSGDAGLDYDGSLYVSDSFDLNNASGVAGPDGMGGMMGGMPGQTGGMGRNGQDGQQGQMTPPEWGQDDRQGQMTPPEWGQDDRQGQMTPSTQAQNGGTSQTAPQQAQNGRTESLKVAPTTQSLSVNGTSRNAEIYNINGSNYFKLRDIAMLLSGTKSQFSVDYDASSKMISVATGSGYAPQGGELASGADRSASCVRSTQVLVIDGRRVELTAYNLGGNNFFQLRELGAALGFDVDYDEATSTILVTSR